jgi:hypothetical protein
MATSNRALIVQFDGQSIKFLAADLPRLARHLGVESTPEYSDVEMRTEITLALRDKAQELLDDWARDHGFNPTYR